MDALSILLNDKGLITFIEVPGDRTVIDLIGDCEGGFVLVGRTDKVAVRCNLDLAFAKEPRRNEAVWKLIDTDLPLILRIFESGEEVGEVVFDTGDVPLIEDEPVDLIGIVVGFIEL